MAEKRVRLPVEERRDQVVAEATALITDVGYHRFSIAELARRCGVTRAGLLHHFPSKEHVLLAVIQHADLEDAAALATQGSWVWQDADLRTVFGRIVRRNAERPELVRLHVILASEALDADHPAHAYFRDRVSGFVDAFGPHLGSAGRDGRAVALELFAYLEGLQLAWLRDPSIDMVAHWHAIADPLLP